MVFDGLPRNPPSSLNAVIVVEHDRDQDVKAALLVAGLRKRPQSAEAAVGSLGVTAASFDLYSRSGVGDQVPSLSGVRLEHPAQGIAHQPLGVVTRRQVVSARHPARLQLIQDPHVQRKQLGIRLRKIRSTHRTLPLPCCCASDRSSARAFNENVMSSMLGIRRESLRAGAGSTGLTPATRARTSCSTGISSRRPCYSAIVGFAHADPF